MIPRGHDIYTYMEQQQNRIDETARKLCPKHCRECEYLWALVDVDVISPICTLLTDLMSQADNYYVIWDGVFSYIECPEECKNCPLMEV